MPITIILLILNVIFTYQGFAKSALFQRYKLHVGSILQGKQYERLITSGFLHGNWNHLIVNMMSLYFMGDVLEAEYRIRFGLLGMLVYLVVYIASLLGGSALAVLMHRNDSQYSAIGASGAIAGLIFALVVVNPSATILLFFVIPMPFWLFAVVYMGYTLFGIRTASGGICHEGHMGGALIGLIFGSLFALDSAIDNWPFLTGLAVPTMLVLYLLYKYPTFGNDPWEWIKRVFQGGNPAAGSQTRSNNYGSGNPFDGPVKQDGLEVNRRAMLQKELDALLDKVSRKGYQNLSDIERHRLDQLGRELGRNTNMGGGRAPSN